MNSDHDFLRAGFNRETGHSNGIGRYAFVPGKGYRVNGWRRLLRAIIGWL